MSAWPSSVATDANLSVAVNSLQTTLGSPAGSGDTTLTLASTTGFPTAGYVTIDSEVISYTGVSGSTLTGCTRGADGTSAAAHASAAPVSATIVAAHHNSLKDEVKAIETTLSGVTGLSPTLPLTASKVMVTDGSGHISTSTVTPTTLAFLDATSSVQTQLNGKQASGTYVANPLTGNLAAGSNKITGLANGTASTDAAAFGQIKLIQTVQTTQTSPSSTTSSTFQGSGLAVSITPTSASNRIKITVSMYGESDSQATALSFTLKRGSTELSGATNGFGLVQCNATNTTTAVPISFSYIDSPATTSATTYTVNFRSTDNTHNVQVCGGSTLSVIIAEEIV